MGCWWEVGEGGGRADYWWEVGEGGGRAGYWWAVLGDGSSPCTNGL